MSWKHMSAHEGNKLRLRMRSAGLPLEGLKWWIVGYSPLYHGFEFKCEQYERLLTMAEKNPKFGANSVTLPGPDPWRDQKIEALGYSEKGVYEYLHLDISTNRPGLCRLYVAPRRWGRWRNALDGPPRYLSNEVYLTIAKRLAVHGIKLEDYIDGNPKVGGTTLDGVNFSPRNYKELAEKVVAAKGGAGQTFIEGKKQGTPDAIDLSFLATSGRGFREINWTDGTQATLDFSALHLALSPVTCNVHIDEFGVVIGGPDGTIALSPDALHHIANELVLKTIIKEFLRDKFGLPQKYIDHLFVELPNAFNRYQEAGFGIEGRWKGIKITGGVSCNLNTGHADCRKYFTLSRSF